MQNKFKPTQTQQFIWLDQNISTNSSRYNIGGYVLLTGDLDVHTFNKSIQRVLEIQEVYSTIISNVNQQLTCVSTDAGNNFELEVLDFTRTASPKEESLAWIKKDFAVPFIIEGN